MGVGLVDNTSSSASVHSGNYPINTNKYSINETEEIPKEYIGKCLEGDEKSIPEGGDELTQYESNTAASRCLSRRLTGADELIEEINKANEPLPKMDNGREYPPLLVSYDGPDDPIHPHNWPFTKKLLSCVAIGLSAFSIATGSAMFAEAADDLMMIHHLGYITVTLGTSLFVYGFAWGPIIRGFIGAAPLVLAPAALVDLFGTGTRGQAVAIFAMVLFGGPMLAPILGGFTVKNSELGWRWISYFTGLIVRKAEMLMRRTGNWGINVPHEEVSLNLREIAEKNITRPIIILFTEPILFLITLYNAFMYGILYLYLTAVPLIFIGGYGFTQGMGELPYLSMSIGVFIPIPEERLPPMMIGSVFYVIGMFWLGWASSFPNNIHWIVPTIGNAFIGAGLILIFLPCLNYIIDCFSFFAASALAGNTLLRATFGAVFRYSHVKCSLTWKLNGQVLY